MMHIDPRISKAFAEQNGFPLEPHLLVLGLMGSHSHGTYLPPQEPTAVDDIDLMGFVVPPLPFHLGLPRWEHWVLQVDELDVVLYSLEKAFRLLLKSNPNIVGLLWLRDEEYVHCHDLFDRLRSRRSLFSSRRAMSAFAGYAYDQLKRMEAFDLARMEEYEELTTTIATRGTAVEVLEADGAKLRYLAQHWNLEHDLLVRFQKLHRSHFSGYMGEKRKAVVRRYRYDVKNAAHLIRLLRMGAEFLETGRLCVYRIHDAEELKAIKRGRWTLEQVKGEAERLFAAIEQSHQHSPLPENPDEEGANELLIELHRGILGL
jgi:predicted nucleotidyltransferase